MRTSVAIGVMGLTCIWVLLCGTCIYEHSVVLLCVGCAYNWYMYTGMVTV